MMTELWNQWKLGSHCCGWAGGSKKERNEERRDPKSGIGKTERAKFKFSKLLFRARFASVECNDTQCFKETFYHSWINGSIDTPLTSLFYDS